MGVVSVIAGASNVVRIGESAASVLSASKALLKADERISGIDNFVFDIPESESLSLKAQITDHFTEDNTALQDHIAISPISVTLTGKISEVVVERNKAAQYAALLITAIGSLSTIAPTLSVSAGQALQKIQTANEQINNLINKYNSLKDLFEDKGITRKQRKAFDDLKKLIFAKGVYTIQTPWANLSNMAIEGVNFEQDETTTDWSTISVTLKQMQFAQTKTTQGKLKGRIVYQKQEVVNKGKTNASVAKQISELISKFGGAS